MLYSPSVDDHGVLAGLSDDDHTIYVLLAGRTGGQTLVGGSAGLRLESGGSNQDVAVAPNGTGKVDVIGHARFGVTAGTQVYIGSAGSDYGFVGFNASPQSGGTYKYAYADYASIMQFASGGVKIQTAPAGSVGGAITFTDRIIVDVSGNMSVGATAPQYKLDVGGAIGMTWTSYSNAYKAAMTPSVFGYSSGYKAIVMGSSSTGSGSGGSVTFSFNYDPSVNSSGTFYGDGREVLFRRGTLFSTPNAANNSYFPTNLVLLDGMVGVGNVTPTAFMDSPASTTAAASCRMRSGTAPTSPNDGDRWNDATAKAEVAFLAGIKQYSANVLFLGGSQKAVYSTTSETTLFPSSGNVGTLTLPANFWTVGKMVEVEIIGELTSHSSPGSIVIAFKVGGSTTVSTASITLPASIGSPSADEGMFRIWVKMRCTSVGASGAFKIYGEFEFYETGGAVSNTFHHYSLVNQNGPSFTVDTTASKVLDVTVTFGSTNDAIYSDIQSVKVVG